MKDSGAKQLSGATYLVHEIMFEWIKAVDMYA